MLRKNTKIPLLRLRRARDTINSKTMRGLRGEEAESVFKFLGQL